jgi:hypothetical protein
MKVGGSMNIQRLDRYRNLLDQYYACEEAILAGAQEYQLNNRRIRRADLSMIRSTIKDIENQIDMMESGKNRNRVIGIMPHDW